VDNEETKAACVTWANKVMAQTDPMAKVDKDLVGSFGFDEEHMTNLGAMLAIANNLSRSAGMFMTNDPWVIEHEWHVTFAEKVVAEAHEQAQAVPAEVARRKQQMQAEMASIEAATTACTPAGPCKAKCDGGDGPSCVAWGNRLWQGSRDVRPKLPEARAAMSRACEAGIQTGCEAIPQIDVDIRAVAAKVDELWGSVQAVGDDIAAELGKRDLARSLEPQMPPLSRMQTERAIQRMMAHQQAVISEQYCPARKAFVAQLGLAEFAKSVAAHCKNDPPVASGQGGEDVPLTSQCQAAYATACP